MEYSIYFENKDANETLSAALAELNDIFFIENSSSESEKNMSENKGNVLVISDNKTFNENLNEIDLNNYEFVENSDNYIEDKVYDDLKLKVKEFFKNGKCLCNPKCFEKIGYEWFLEYRAGFESLDKKMQDMVIKGQLLAFQKDKNTRKVTTENGKFLHVIIKHLREHGLEEYIHNNTDRSPKNMNRVDINYKQMNYIIDKAELSDEGKQEKGVNCTLSLVCHAIHKYNYGEKKLGITCDNCVE
ncbi:hypothetical protein C1646_774745 [Rhizophagus diaphanus]|nr:hypothetical protein C1646_774745 [Rhizophagus diaphanus] [Rhizophagus sp. MUCL 43196]